MAQTFFFDLQKHHINYLGPVIEARMKLLKKRIIKEFGHNWYDMEEAQINTKVKEKSDEYFRLDQVLNQIYK